MMNTLSPVVPVDAIPFHCAVCKRYLTSTDGGYVRSAPCQCGFQTTVEAVGRRARQAVEMGGQVLEVKSR